MIDLAPDLTAWLASPEARQILRETVREAVRAEIRAALDEELLDVQQASELLSMSVAAVRKAVERGQLPCIRLGRRVRFRRAELLSVSLRS